MNIYSTIFSFGFRHTSLCLLLVLLRAQERPATLILTVTSGLRITRARHVYKGYLQTGSLKFCSSTKNDRNAKNVSITTVCRNTGREKSCLQER